MAISFDNANQQFLSSTSSNSFSFTNAGNIMFFGIGVRPGDPINAPTYNGVSGTLIGQEAVSTFFKVYLYYLLNPTAGANTAVASYTSATDQIYFSVVSYKSAKQSGQPDASNITTQSSGTTFTQSVTTVANNCWTVQYVFCNSGGLSASTGSTLRGSILNSSVSAFFDSNGAITPAGSTSMVTNSGNGITSGVIASFSPLAATANSDFLAFM